MSRFTTEGIDPAPVYKKSRDPHSGQVPPSVKLREELAAEGKPVIVAFSRGKDSICTMISLLEMGIEVIPVHLYRVPGLKFEEDSIKHFEDFFQMKIYNIPHGNLWYYFINGVFMEPWQRSIIMAAGIQEIPNDVMWWDFKESLGLDPLGTWVADGVRAADSPARRLSMITHGPTTDSPRKWGDEVFRKKYHHSIWDWKIADIRRCLDINKVQLPIDYDLFGRTFDGLDYRFIKPLQEHMPEAFETVKEWFPAVEMELMRHEWIR